MTLRRSERSTEDVLYELASSYPGGVEALAVRLGISPKVLYKKLSPANPDHGVKLSEFSAILEMCQGANRHHALDPLQALCFRHGGVFVQIEDFDQISDDCIYKGVSQVMADIGAFTGTLNAALEDGTLTEHEMDHLEPKARKTFAVMASLWARIKGRLKRDSAKTRRPFFAKQEEMK